MCDGFNFEDWRNSASNFKRQIHDTPRTLDMPIIIHIDMYDNLTISYCKGYHISLLQITVKQDFPCRNCVTRALLVGFLRGPNHTLKVVLKCYKDLLGEYSVEFCKYLWDW